MTNCDVVLYAHDGRGIGHASRVAAISIALKRKNPKLRLLSITGSQVFGELAPTGLLDWIKLPSYRSLVRNGNVAGGLGSSGYEQQFLVKLRTKLLSNILQNLAPRCLLVDFIPRGKLGELSDAIQQLRKCFNTKIVLGCRGIVGPPYTEVHQEILGSHTLKYIDKFYDLILIYTDKRIVNIFDYHKELERFRPKIIHVGYVARAAELTKVTDGFEPEDHRVDLLISFGGASGSLNLFKLLADVKKGTNYKGQRWAVYVGPGLHIDERKQVKELFRHDKECQIRFFSTRYFSALMSASLFIGHGGYNTITDAIWARRSACFICRDVSEQDQILHLKALCSKGFWGIQLHEKNLTPEVIESSFDKALSQRPEQTSFDLDISGAERAAKEILRLLNQS